MKIVFLSLACLFLTACSYSGQSQRSGQIVKMASEGFFNRTDEVEIIKGSLAGGSGAFGTKFDFTIDSPEVLAVAKSAFSKGQEIIVTYHSQAFCPFSSANIRCNFADKISLVK